MIEITDDLLVGIGSHRTCYRHPQHPDRCIKVLHDPTPHEVRGVKCEMRYYRHLERTLRDWSGIPRYFGTVQTSRGEGQVFELMTDFDGKPCVGMDKLIRECDSREKAEHIIDLLVRLKKYIWENSILVTSLNLENVLARRISSNEDIPVICDNIGERSAIPLTFWFKLLARRKQERYWRKAMVNNGLQECLARFGLPPSALP